MIHGGVEDLESSAPSGAGKKAMLNYTRSGNIGNYLGLSEVESLYMPVPVNFVFLGFDGNGNHGFKLGQQELERWFTKIDHVFEHTRVPRIGEVLTPFYKISTDKSWNQNRHLPLVSHVNYNLSVHAIELGEKVLSVFEHAIKVLSRRDNISDLSEDESVLWQVDIDGISSLFDSLVEYLQLDNAYNVFVLNPKRDVKKANYGYRRGLSESEIQFLKENKNLQTQVLQSGRDTWSTLDIAKSISKMPLYSSHPAQKFSWTAAGDFPTDGWTGLSFDALNNVDRNYQGKDQADIIRAKALQMLKGEMKSSMEKWLKSGDLSGLHHECLTDMWIGGNRWAFIDLTAGPFSWGPAVGGEGVRTEISLPNVEKSIGGVQELSEVEAEDQLQEVIRERFSVFTDEHQAIDILLAEIDIYELFAFKHCVGRRTKLALCDELDERMQDLKRELQSYDSNEHDESHKQKALEALKRMENWNLFSDISEESQNYTVARDSFLAQLGSSLWGSMKHVIAPSVADGAYHYYDKIAFQLFFITQEKTRNAKHLPVDITTLMEGLSALGVHSQNVVFSQTLLALSEDPALAMAFSISRRAAAVPLLLVNGTYRTTVRSYLDSSILQSQLQKLSSHGSLKGTHSNARSTLEVPIFWFIYADPLFLDKHHQARALSDMVIVVQSEASSWESHLQCNGESILFDLRAPIKAAIAASAEHLAGLLPLHLTYNHAHETAIENWVWSVGCNPLSVTSQGWQISRFSSDAIARSYILTSLEESVQTLNTAIHSLFLERTTSQGFKVFKSQERGLVSQYNSVVSLWKRISKFSGDLHYDEALRLLSFLDEASRGFSTAVNTTIAALHPIHCTRERKVDLELDLSTIPAFVVVIAIFVYLLRPKHPKAKIN